MTPEPQKEYIITASQLAEFESHYPDVILEPDRTIVTKMGNAIRSRPYTPPTSAEQLVEIKTEAYREGYNDGQIVGAKEGVEPVLEKVDLILKCEWSNAGCVDEPFRGERRELVSRVRNEVSILRAQLLRQRGGEPG